MKVKYKNLYFHEADEKIAELNASLLQFEKNQKDFTAINNAMRAAHTLKSSSAAVGYAEMSHLAHEMEDMFELVRTNKKTLSSKAVEVLFAATDALQFSIGSLKQGEEPTVSETLLSRMRVNISRIKEEELKNKKTETPEVDKKVDRPKDAEIEDEDIVEQQKEKAEKQKKEEAEDEVKEEEGTTMQSEVSTLQSIDVVKVDVSTLDTLMNLTEELLVENMRFSEVLRRIEKSVAEGAENVTSEMTNLKSSSDAFNRLVGDLQYQVTQARMLPLGQVLERFPRLVRDLGKKSGKAVSFRVSGQDIELDRTVIDRIGEPLIHLVRNAVDHGIDGTGSLIVRASRMQDTVVIEVENTGMSIDWSAVVTSAMSRGILPQEKGSNYLQTLNAHSKDVSTEALYRVQNQVKHLLFHPQLSTNSKVTETSGRGVGLHIVKTVIESFGGTVEVQSPVISEKNVDNQEEKQGTRFTLRLPLTLAIIQAMLVRVSSHTFAVPFTQIDRTVRVGQHQVKRAFDQEIAVVEDEDVPIIRLSDRFQIPDFIPSTSQEDSKRQNEELTIKNDEQKENKHSEFRIQHSSELMLITKPGTLPVAGLIVDELIAEQDIVVKPLKGVLQHSRGFAGITLLGDGKPALILDVATLT
jgi:two-component system, chemotaxis family, sensor kinase CheA